MTGPPARPDDQARPPSRSGRITATGGVGIVAATSAVISYNHVRHLALRAGESELAALLLPLALDGAIVAAVAVILTDSRAKRRPAVLTWVLLALGLIGSLSANIASAAPTVTARAVAAWPPMLLAVGVEVLANLSRRSGAAQRSNVGEQGCDVPDPVSAGGLGGAAAQATTRPGIAAANLAILNAEEADAARTVEVPLQDRARELLDQWAGTGEPCTGPHLAGALDISIGYARRLIRQWNDQRTRPASEPHQLALLRSSRSRTGTEYPRSGAARN